MGDWIRTKVKLAGLNGNGIGDACARPFGMIECREPQTMRAMKLKEKIIQNIPEKL